MNGNWCLPEEDDYAASQVFGGKLLWICWLLLSPVNMNKKNMRCWLKMDVVNLREKQVMLISLSVSWRCPQKNKLLTIQVNIQLKVKKTHPYINTNKLKEKETFYLDWISAEFTCRYPLFYKFASIWKHCKYEKRTHWHKLYLEPYISKQLDVAAIQE